MSQTLDGGTGSAGAPELKRHRLAFRPVPAQISRISEAATTSRSLHRILHIG
jgi:hypothetical protein